MCCFCPPPLQCKKYGQACGRGLCYFVKYDVLNWGPPKMVPMYVYLRYMKKKQSCKHVYFCQPGQIQDGRHFLRKSRKSTIKCEVIDIE